MPNLSIKDVPEEWAHALRQRAARHHRSLQGELMAIVEQAVSETGGGTASPGSGAASGAQPRVVGYDQRGWPIVRQGSKSPAQVIAELQAKYPEPIVDQLSSIKIIRAERDSR